jgi:hypothetical protein
LRIIDNVYINERRHGGSKLLDHAFRIIVLAKMGSMVLERKSKDVYADTKLYVTGQQVLNDYSEG